MIDNTHETALCRITIEVWYLCEIVCYLLCCYWLEISHMLIPINILTANSIVMTGRGGRWIPKKHKSFSVWNQKDAILFQNLQMWINIVFQFYHVCTVYMTNNIGLYWHRDSKYLDEIYGAEAWGWWYSQFVIHMNHKWMVPNLLYSIFTCTHPKWNWDEDIWSNDI